MERPDVIRLVSYVRIPREAHRRKITRRAVLARDSWTCQYCGSRKSGLTVDHVIPRSRGGKSVWENIVAACANCNRRKGNRLPREIQMHPKSNPKAPGPTVFIQVAASPSILRNLARVPTGGCLSGTLAAQLPSCRARHRKTAHTAWRGAADFNPSRVGWRGCGVRPCRPEAGDLGGDGGVALALSLLRARRVSAPAARFNCPAKPGIGVAELPLAPPPNPPESPAAPRSVSSSTTEATALTRSSSFMFITFTLGRRPISEMPLTEVRWTHAVWEMKSSSWCFADDQGAGEAALLSVRFAGQPALGPTALDRVLGDRGPLAVAVLGDDEQLGVLAGDVHRQHPVLARSGGDVHALDAGGVAAHRPDVVLAEARSVAGLGDQEHVVVCPWSALPGPVRRGRGP